ncbi:unnamed protein product [Clonostachys rhizophaga]|uniref:Complex 1 LYR protein domain-containing protein n=1 Tax=Clonostachys rhizophaga TaxID=160324 RepID=A0A9N9VB35_9HYPO|nr:unnamed protein product [Clonostachys rhizophaga]
MRLSGLQKEVLALYRRCLRESRKKPESTRAHFEQFARLVAFTLRHFGSNFARVPNYTYLHVNCRTEFTRNLALDKRDFAAIEFLIRKGRRQLENYASPGIKDIH